MTNQDVDVVLLALSRSAVSVSHTQPPRIRRWIFVRIQLGKVFSMTILLNDDKTVEIDRYNRAALAIFKL